MSSDKEKVIEAMVKEFASKYREAAAVIIPRIKELLNQGISVSEAIETALSEQSITGAIRSQLEDALFKAAAIGYGITPAAVNISARAAIITKLMTLPWIPGDMPLSTKLHGLDTVLHQKIRDVIEPQIKAGTKYINLARKLYDGYGYGRTINEATLPKYLQELSRLARTADANDLAFKRALAKAKDQADKLAGHGAPTKALRSAYEQLIRESEQQVKKSLKQLSLLAENSAHKALDNAIRVAVEERSRYYAERIARTELARAWADGFYAKNHNDTDVIAYRWKISSRHPRYDICDLHAKANMYGLGAGVYPKNKVPRQPAHPHCLCHWERIFDGELDDKSEVERVKAAGDEFLNKASRYDRQQLLGIHGEQSWGKGADWRGKLRSWQEHENPAVRLRIRDFVAKTQKKEYTINNDINTKWFHQNGEPKWPPNNGFLGKPNMIKLDTGTLIDRYGDEKGSFASPYNTPYGERSLCPGTQNKPYKVYVVINPIDVLSGITAPWFDELGGGMQYKLSQRIKDLIREGYLKEVRKDD